MRLSWAIGLDDATSYLAPAAVPVELIQATAASLGLQVQTLSDVRFNAIAKTWHGKCGNQ